MKILLPTSEELSSSDITKNLSKDNIVISEITKDVYDTVSKKHTSYIQRQVISSRHPDLFNIDRYYDTKLSELLSSKFIEDKMPEVVKSSEIIVKHVKAGNRILLVSDFDCDFIIHS